MLQARVGFVNNGPAVVDSRRLAGLMLLGAGLVGVRLARFRRPRLTA